MAELPATAWAVLGLLSFGKELSGYDLKKWADNSLRFFYWSPAGSQIYSELRRLEKAKFVTSRVASQDELRNKRLFSITPAGLAAITEWVRHADVDPPVLKHGVALRIWLGHLATPEHLRAIVLEHIEQSQQAARDARDASKVASATPGWEFPALTTAWSQRYYEAEVRLARQMLVELDALAV
jgi:DNA-binding PadR family transcriptional regulator